MMIHLIVNHMSDDDHECGSSAKAEGFLSFAANTSSRLMPIARLSANIEYDKRKSAVLMPIAVHYYRGPAPGLFNAAACGNKNWCHPAPHTSVGMSRGTESGSAGSREIYPPCPFCGRHVASCLGDGGF